MQSQKIKKRSEFEGVLEEIEKIQSDNIRELFKVSCISRDNFIHGAFELSQEEHKALVDAMIKDPILDFLLHDELNNWEQISDAAKLASLETVYEVLDVGSKLVWQQVRNAVPVTGGKHGKEETSQVPDLYKRIVKNSFEFRALRRTTNETASNLTHLIKTLEEKIDKMEEDRAKKEAELISTIYNLTERLKGLTEEALNEAAKKASEVAQQFVLENKSV